MGGIVPIRPVTELLTSSWRDSGLSDVTDRSRRLSTPIRKYDDVSLTPIR